MEFKARTRQRVQHKPEYEHLDAKYPHNLIFYDVPPVEDITLQEFEDLALERLRLHRVLEQAGSKNLRLLSDDWKEYVNAELTREGLKGFLRLCTTSGGGNAAKQESVLLARRRDHISHFILRLAYCRSEDLRRWFVTREMELFKYKFSALTSAEIRHFLELNKLNFMPLTEEQKNEVKDGLYESTAGQSVAKIELLDFYKIPFTQALDLVRTRRCFLKAGYAYVNTHDFVSVLAIKHQAIIEDGLERSLRHIRIVETDERLYHLIKSLHTSYTGKDYTVNKDASIPIESLDELAKKSMPLCMRQCHEHLRAHHHMKHGGRMQYGLFLKGIGVTLEDSLRFWREEFCKKIDAEKFSKSYEYNIHHNYGKKGSMVNYTPYSCLKIIKEHIAQDDCHGCPYHMLDTGTMKSKLTGYGLSAAHVQDVLSYMSKGHYQLACAKYFQITHDAPMEPTITHPNQYFEESQILMGQRAEKKPDKKANAMRKAVKRSANDTTMLYTKDNDDELWNIAEKEERAYEALQKESLEWEADDLDLTAIDY